MHPLDFPTFAKTFDKKVANLGLNWEAVGFYTHDGKVFPFGTDTKVISTVFEALAAPILQEIALEHDLLIEGSEQTIYPDFTLSPLPGKPPRIAIDIKTTYRRIGGSGETRPFRYTLGSYTSFLRTPGAAKNIKYPYKEYGHHWVIGFLYSRRKGVAAKVYGKKVRGAGLICPYKEVEYFVQEKHKIVGLTPASGNTANIGSFPTSSIQDLRDGRGPFAGHPKELCDDYWRYYGRTSAERAYSTIEEFRRWRKK